MRSAPPNSNYRPIHRLEYARTIFLAIFLVANAARAVNPASGASNLPANQASESTDASSGAYFARLIQARNEIEFLASHKRYQDLLNTSALLCRALEQANTVLPNSERQRAARFLAASRSLEQLSKALHSFMWNGKSDQLFETSDKLVQLMTHIGTLITPEELARAQAYLGTSKD